MWVYSQSSGSLSRDGNVVGVGYSGFGDGKNNPILQDHPDFGPIPQGRYSIGPPECMDSPGPHGPFVMRLTPDQTNQMFSRSGFLLHGDSIVAPGSASHGCIIMGRLIREAVAASGDTELAVVV